MFKNDYKWSAYTLSQAVQQIWSKAIIYTLNINMSIRWANVYHDKQNKQHFINLHTLHETCNIFCDDPSAPASRQFTQEYLQG